MELKPINDNYCDNNTLKGLEFNKKVSFNFTIKEPKENPIRKYFSWLCREIPSFARVNKIESVEQLKVRI